MSVAASTIAMGAVSAIISLLLIGIALLLACVLLWIVCRGTACSSLPASPHAGADDPFFSAFGEAPTLPADWQRERVIGNYRRHLDADDFRAWGVPGPFCDRPPSACLPPRRNEGGGRPNHASRSGTAVVLAFPDRRRA
jgi:hypothetical protein